MKARTMMQRSHFAWWGAACCAAGMQIGCAAQHPYQEVAGEIPALEPGHVRVFLYTISGTFFDSFLFNVNGKDVGQVLGHQFVYVDEPAGRVDINVDLQGTSLTEYVGLNLAAGETRYFRVNKEILSFSGKLDLISIKADEALLDLNHCEYVGPRLTGASKK